MRMLDYGRQYRMLHAIDITSVKMTTGSIPTESAIHRKCPD